MIAKLCYKLLGYAFFPEKARQPGPLAGDKILEALSDFFVTPTVSGRANFPRPACVLWV